MNRIPNVSTMFVGYGKDPMGYAVRYAEEMARTIKTFYLQDISAVDAFIANMGEVEDRELDYPTRKKHFDSAVFLYACFDEVREEFEYCPKEVALAKRFARRNRKILDLFEDGINYAVPREAGLYFIGETHFNPHTDEKFYWVKIGLSTNLAKRMKQYDTHCPMLWRIAFKTNLHKCLEIEEEYYHDRLKEIAVAGCNHNEEWFLVNRETYLEMCNKGFSYFD